MQIKGKEITDECSKCGMILECRLCMTGHGIGVERDRVAEMIKCQIDHRRLRESQNE